jgi:hypothetical protein
MFALSKLKTFGVSVALVIGFLLGGTNQITAQTNPVGGNDAGTSITSEFRFDGFGVEVGTNQDPVEMSHDGTAGPWFKMLCFDQPPDRSIYYISQIIEVSGSDFWTGWYEEILTEDWILLNDGTNNISFLVGGNVPPGLFMILSSDGRGVYFGFDPISPELGPFVNINLPVVWNGPNGDPMPMPADVCIETKAYLLGQPASPHTIAVDIKPQSCPNPLNTKSKGVLPVAILGTEDFDVFDIDLSTILLEGVAPERNNLDDVATPFNGESRDDCLDCTQYGPDGLTDLTLKFDTQEVVAALGEVIDGECLILSITGYLLDGTPIEGGDVVIIKKKGNQQK